MDPKETLIEVKLVDSFVLNKIGEGHGESRLYLGGMSSKQHIQKIFNKDKPLEQALRFSKKNILNTLGFFEPFFLNPKSFYLDNGKLISFTQPLSNIYNDNLKTLDRLKEEITEVAELLPSDKSGRTYLRVKKESLLRRFFLPHSVKIIFKKREVFIDCSIKPEIIPIKKAIKVNGQKHNVEFDYMSGYDFKSTIKT